MNRLDIRQVLDIMDECGYMQVKLSDQTSQSNWYEYEAYEFENEFTVIVLTFIVDAMSSYSFGNSRRKPRAKTPVMSEVEVRVTDRQSGEIAEYTIDMWRTGYEKMSRFIGSFGFGMKNNSL